jgi:hypothetical protein
MKKPFCIFLIHLLCFYQLQAQDLKGRLLVTGGLSFNFQNDATFKNESFGINPSGFYFFSNRIAAGLETYFNFFESSFNGLLTGQRRIIGFGPVLRYMPFRKDKYGVFIDLKSLFSLQNSKTGGFEPEEVDSFNQTLIISPGFFYRATPKIWLEANMDGISSVYLLSQKRNSQKSEINNKFNLKGDFSLSIFSVKVGFLLGKSKTTE